MLGQRFLPTSYQKKLFEMDYNKHTQKLAEIKNADRRKDIKSTSSANWKASSEHFKHLQFVAQEKIAVLDKNNQVLLDKLVEISRTAKPLYKTNEFANHPKTLNSPYRKKELERIALENEAMARRLISQHGSVDRKQLKQDFKTHLNLKKSVQKLTSPKFNERMSDVHSPKSGSDKKMFRVKSMKSNKLKRSTSEGAESRIQQINENRMNETHEHKDVKPEVQEQASVQESHKEQSATVSKQSVEEKASETTQQNQQEEVIASETKVDKAESTKEVKDSEANPSQNTVQENKDAKEADKTENQGRTSVASKKAQQNGTGNSRKSSYNKSPPVTQNDNVNKSNFRESATSVDKQNVSKEVVQGASHHALVDKPVASENPEAKEEVKGSLNDTEKVAENKEEPVVVVEKEQKVENNENQNNTPAPM